MAVLYTLIALITFIIIILILGKIDFNEKSKKYILQIVSGIYNMFLGYIDTYVILIIYAFLGNMPKGSSYEVPSSEAGFNFCLGLITTAIYLLILVPINIYARKKGKINPKVYITTSAIATILGIMIFWMLIGKNKKLF